MKAYLFNSFPSGDICLPEPKPLPVVTEKHKFSYWRSGKLIPLRTINPVIRLFSLPTVFLIFLHDNRGYRPGTIGRIPFKVHFETLDLE